MATIFVPTTVVPGKTETRTYYSGGPISSYEVTEEKVLLKYSAYCHDEREMYEIASPLSQGEWLTWLNAPSKTPGQFLLHARGPVTIIPSEPAYIRSSSSNSADRIRGIPKRQCAAATSPLLRRSGRGEQVYFSPKLYLATKVR
eukprot:7382802-Pyramimonas_sp.AAC.1